MAASVMSSGDTVAGRAATFFASMTSGVQAFFFAGSVFGAPLFGAGAGALGGFGSCYLLLAPLPVLCGAVLLRSSFTAARASHSGG